MAIHISLLIIISAFGFMIYRGGTAISIQRNKYFVRFSLILVFIIQSLRGSSVGWDTYRYEISFSGIREGYYNSMAASWEPLFILLNRTVGLFTSNPQWLLVVCSFVILYGYGYFVLHNTGENESAFWPIFFFITLYHYFNSSNLLREYLAIAFIINIYTVLRQGKSKKNWILAVTLLVLGFLFHRTAAIGFVLFVPFIIEFKDAKQLLLTALGAVLVFIGYERVLEVFLRVFPYFLKYEKGVRLSGAEAIGASYLVLTLLKVIMLLLALFNKSEDYRQELYSLSFIMIIAAAFTVLRTRIMLALRAGYYFETFFPLFIMKFVYRMGRYRGIVYTLAYMFGWAFFLYTIFNTNGGSRGNVPYYFFWQ